MDEEQKLEIQRKAKELAEQHWAWVEKWFHMVYVDAFIHGYGHGAEEVLKNILSSKKWWAAKK